jgi:hypothetical protein
MMTDNFRMQKHFQEPDRTVTFDRVSFSEFGFVEMLPNLSCRGGIPKFNHAPGAPPRRCGDPDCDRGCILVRGNIKERSGEPCPKNILLGVGQVGVKPHPVYVFPFFLNIGFQQSPEFI